MKIHFFLPFLLLLMISIQGTFSALDEGKMVFRVTNPLTGNPVLLQELTMLNGEFSIDIERFFPCFMVIVLAESGGSFQMTYFFIDSDDAVRLEGEDFEHCTITSGAMQAQHTIFQNSIAEYERELSDLHKLRQFGDTWRSLTMEEAQPIRKALQKKIIACIVEHIQLYPNELYSAYLLHERRLLLPDDELRALYATLSTEVQESVFAYSERHRFQYAPTLQDRDEFVDGPHYDIHGVEQSISSVRNKERYTILHFWNSSPRTSEQIHMVKNIHQRFTNDNVHLVSIGIDDNKELWKESIEKYGMNWTHLNDFYGVNTHFATMYQLHSVASVILLIDHITNKITYQGLLGLKSAETESTLAKSIYGDVRANLPQSA